MHWSTASVASPCCGGYFCIVLPCGVCFWCTFAASSSLRWRLVAVILLAVGYCESWCLCMSMYVIWRASQDWHIVHDGFLCGSTAIKETLIKRPLSLGDLMPHGETVICSHCCRNRRKIGWECIPVIKHHSNGRERERFVLRSGFIPSHCFLVHDSVYVCVAGTLVHISLNYYVWRDFVQLV